MRNKTKAMWQWQEFSKWHPYAPQDENAIEKGYQNRHQVPVLAITIHGKQYVIDYNHMSQTNVKTNFQRSIRRQLFAPVAPDQQQQQQQQVQELPQQPIVLKCKEEQSFANSLSKMSSKHIEDYCANICSWNTVSQQDLQQKFKDDRCSICLCEFDGEDEEGSVVVICNGSHAYHKTCLVQCLDKTHGFVKCAICNKVYGIRKGTMPKGTMKVRKLPVENNEGLQLEGYEGKCGVIVIDYHFPNGVQGPEHPHPGVSYQGTSRTAYLPDDETGNKLLKMLMLSFQRRLTFTVGRSVTQNKDNCVVWNNIHHKTNTHGGSVNFAFPDATYFDRVLAELQDKGITEADIANM